MPIMAAQGQNDARSAAWLLANTARSCIARTAAEDREVVVMNNVFRLLETYRVNTFFGLEQPPLQSQVENLSVVPPTERHLNDVYFVFEQALAIAFVNSSKSDAIGQIEDVIRAVTYPSKWTTSDDERAKATRFFDEVLKHLQIA